MEIVYFKKQEKSRNFIDSHRVPCQPGIPTSIFLVTWLSGWSHNWTVSDSPCLTDKPLKHKFIVALLLLEAQEA